MSALPAGIGTEHGSIKLPAHGHKLGAQKKHMKRSLSRTHNGPWLVASA